MKYAFGNHRIRKRKAAAAKVRQEKLMERWLVIIVLTVLIIGGL